jgi:acetyltransferase-like isoleucine patch superfamily enzyme
MKFAGRGFWGKMFARLAVWVAPPHKASIILAGMNPRGYIAPSAEIYHSNLSCGSNVFIGDRVILFEGKGGGQIMLGNKVRILRDSILETGLQGKISIGENTWIHPRCQINAYKGSIYIGCDVQIAPNCAFYCHNHGISSEANIAEQPIEVKGDIVIGDHSWLGVGVSVLSGVKIGKGAVIGAGSVVTRDVPDGGIAIGVPARVIKMRADLK